MNVCLSDASLMIRAKVNVNLAKVVYINVEFNKKGSFYNHLSHHQE